MRAAGVRGGTVDALRRPVVAIIRAPVVRQRLRNNCESAALEILSSVAGQRVGQLRIQRAFPRSGPLAPRGAGTIKANFGEHTVVLHGIERNGDLVVSNPLKGTRETWSKDDFETMWLRLGRCAPAA